MARFKYTPKKRLLLAVGATMGVIAIVALVLIIYFGASSGEEGAALEPPNPVNPRPPSSAPLGVFSHAAVATNGQLCAEFGRDVLLEGGTAVDAAITSLICEGVMCPQSMGVGGGFLMTVYNATTGLAHVINAREVAAAAATESMFHGDPDLSQRGGLSIAVPGEIRGYETAYRLFGGGVPWPRLFEPTIAVCREGFNVTAYLAGVLQSAEDMILANEGLKEILVNPATGKVLVEGDLMKREKLADTLRTIADRGAEEFYTGELSKLVVADIAAAGGIITAEDLAKYQVEVVDALNASIAGHRMYSVPVPGSGVLLAFMLNILDGFLPGDTELDTNQRIVEAFKYAFAKRTELGDLTRDEFVPDADHVRELIKNLTSPEYASDIRAKISDTETHQDPAYYGAVLAAREDHGTAHLSVLSADGDAVAVTSTVNLYFGSAVRSSVTGIIYNDEMDDFSAPNITNAFGVPPSPANFIHPGKRPMSSMCPAVFVEEATGRVSLVTGAAGGTKITSATALIAIHSLLLGKDLKQALDEPRFHHQLFPMSVDYEYGFIDSFVRGLEKVGHKTTRSMTAGSSVTGIARAGPNVTACYDFRRSGSVAGY